MPCWLRNAVGAALVIVLSSGASGWSQDIMVTDLGAIAKAAAEVTKLETEIQQNIQMLKSLGSDISPGLSSLLSDSQQLMSALNNVSQTGQALSSALNTQFPQSFTPGGTTITTQMQSIQGYLRQGQQAAYNMQNQVVANQQSVGGLVNSAVASSNAAGVGQTATAQATNQLLSALSTQLTDLQNLMITMSRTAQDQAMAAQGADAAQRSDTGTAVQSYTPTWSYAPPESY